MFASPTEFNIVKGKADDASMTPWPWTKPKFGNGGDKSGDSGGDNTIVWVAAAVSLGLVGYSMMGKK
jgi:hypothetical protein